MFICKNIDIRIGIGWYIHIFPCYQLHLEADTSIAMSTPNIQMLVANILHEKGPGISGEMADWSILKCQKGSGEKKKESGRKTPESKTNKTKPTMIGQGYDKEHRS